MVPVAYLVVRLLTLSLPLLEVGFIVASYLRLESFALWKIMWTTMVLIAWIPRLHRPDISFPFIPLLLRDVGPNLLHRQVLLLLLASDHGRMRQTLS